MQNRPIATFDLTFRCPFACQHCYVGDDDTPELSDGRMLDGIAALRDERAIDSAFWVGGEPLLRLPLVRRAIRLFRRNALSTSAALPVPADLDCGLLVSVDGPRATHDRLRGVGAYDRAARNTASLPTGSFALSTTLTAQTLEAIEALPELVQTWRAVGVLVGFYVGPSHSPLALDDTRRERAIDRLQTLVARRRGVLLNSAEGLDRLRPRHGADLSRHCIYRGRAVAFDPQLREKRPCTFGAQHNCQRCGCPVVAEQRARDQGSAAASAVLRALFPVSRVAAPAAAAVATRLSS